MNADGNGPASLGSYDEPQNSGAIVAVHYGDYRYQECFVRSGANIGNWYPLGGEFGRPRVWIDHRTELEKMLHRPGTPGHGPGPGEVPMHPCWEDVLARGPVTLLVPGDADTYRTGWRNGRRRMVEQMETVVDDDA